jgi:glycosyltransferase involved in cell wall biosynthesis
MDTVVAQTYANWEHILVDDCKNDGSVAILEEYSRVDPRIKPLRLLENSGAGAARNKAIEQAKGAYIAFLDSDDRWYPQKLERQVSFMKDNGYYFSFTSYDMMDEDGNQILKEVTAASRITYANALYKNPIGCLTAMYDARFFGKQLMPEIRKRQDYALWLKLLKNTDAHGLQEILATYRVRTNSVSSNKLGLLKYEWKIYREEERLSLPRSIFYLISAILLKMKTYF